MSSKLKGFIGEALIYGFANVFSRVFAMLLIPLYASYLGKIDYSNLIMLQSVFSILTFLLGLNSGVFYYYYEYDNKKYRKMVFSSWFYYQVVIATALVISLYFFSSQLAQLFIVNNRNVDELIACIGILGLQFYPYLVNNTNINLYRIDRKPKKVMFITLLEAIFTLIFIGVGLEFYDFGLFEILLSQLAARALVSILFVKTILFYLPYIHYSFKLLKKMFAFSWPFFLISIFQWLIMSVDKFIGADVLQNKEDVALLALAMQLALPITVLADMIRMAIGPFVMSIRKDHDADKNYQSIYDLSVYTSLIVLIALVISTPWLTLLLADETYLEVLEVIPLIAFANVVSLIANQFALNFSLVKKNIHILYATVIAGIAGFVINFLLMESLGFIVSGYSQVASYVLMAIYLFFMGRKIANNHLSLRLSWLMMSVVLFFISFIYWNLDQIYANNKFYLLFPGILAILLISAIYLKSVRFNFKKTFRKR